MQTSAVSNQNYLYRLTTTHFGDESWKQLTACLNFGIFNRPTKNSNSSYSTEFILGFQSK